MKPFEFRYDGKPSLLSGSVTPPAPLYAVMRIWLRVKPRVAVRSSVGERDCVSLRVNRFSVFSLGPPAQGSAKLPKQLKTWLLLH